jgi:hypothetical protein
LAVLSSKALFVHVERCAEIVSGSIFDRASKCFFICYVIAQVTSEDGLHVIHHLISGILLNSIRSRAFNRASGEAV